MDFILLIKNKQYTGCWGWKSPSSKIQDTRFYWQNWQKQLHASWGTETDITIHCAKLIPTHEHACLSSRCPPDTPKISWTYIFFPGARHYLILHRFQNNSFLKIPVNAARYPVVTRSPQWMNIHAYLIQYDQKCGALEVLEVSACREQYTPKRILITVFDLWSP